MTTESLSISGQQRATYGVIVTLRNESGDVEVAHRSGPPATALREVCELADEREGEWRVLSISTPATVWRDLQGSRDQGEFGEDYHWHGEPYRFGSRPVHPEAVLLARIGRSDLLAPPLVEEAA